MSDANDSCNPSYTAEATGAIETSAKSARSDIHRPSNANPLSDKKVVPAKRIGRPKGRKTTSHSHLIRPKRPRSAYNFFVQNERNKIVREAGLGDSPELSSTEHSCDPDQDHFQILVTNEIQENGKRKRGRPRGRHYRPRKRAKHHGLVDFHHLAKETGKKWRSLSAEDRKPFDLQARVDLENYRKAMQQYQTEVDVFEHLQAAESGTSSSAIFKYDDGPKDFQDDAHRREQESAPQSLSGACDSVISSDSRPLFKSTNQNATFAKVDEEQVRCRTTQDAHDSGHHQPATFKNPGGCLPPACRRVLERYQGLKEAANAGVSQYPLEVLAAADAPSGSSELALKGLSTAALINQVLESHQPTEASIPPPTIKESHGLPKMGHDVKSNSEMGKGDVALASGIISTGLVTSSTPRVNDNPVDVITHDSKHYCSLGNKEIVPRSAGETDFSNSHEEINQSSKVCAEPSSSEKQMLPAASFLVEFAEKNFED